MFRAGQANPFDEVVGKATDENLTQENWALIIDVCDKVNPEENGYENRNLAYIDFSGKDAVAALIKRLAHRNANVQLFTLELANALSQNCGIKIHKELASRSFTDALLRLAADRSTHQQVKTRILERMTDWAEMFSSNPDLGIMEQAYSRLKSQNPSLAPPSKPFKREITEADRRKEEDELQRALELSITDKTPQPTRRDTAGSTTSVQAPNQPVSSGASAATTSRVRALYDFQPSEPGELQFRKGDVIAVLESVYKDWWKGLLRGQTGIFPLNYVEKLQDPTPDDLEREAAIEAEVFGQMRNVEKLLALLSTSSGADVRDNEEITQLYQSTIAIRPKLVELINKYSQKKDDFTQLNEKFIKSRRDYEAMLEASMSQHPPHAAYGRPGPSQGSYSSAYGDAQPQRYYTPAPATSPGEYPPPREGPAPFYMVPPGAVPPQQQQQQHPQQYGQQPLPAQYLPPQPDYSKPTSPPLAQPPLAELGRNSIYSQNPQELAATNPYDQGAYGAHGAHGAQDPDAGLYSYPPQSASPVQVHQHQPYQQKPQQQHYQAYGAPQHAPPGVPQGVPPPSQTPVSLTPAGHPLHAGQHAQQHAQQQRPASVYDHAPRPGSVYDSGVDMPAPLQTHHAGGPGQNPGAGAGPGAYQYQAYKPSAPPASSAAGPSDPSDFYR